MLCLCGVHDVRANRLTCSATNAGIGQVTVEII